MTLRFVAVNHAAIAHYGYEPEEFMRMTLADLGSPGDADRLLQQMGDAPSATECQGVWTHKHKNGANLEAEVTVQALEVQNRPCVAVYARDVAQNRLLERQLHESQKMEALGLFVGAVAHDFNNLLGIITSYSALALGALGPGNPVRDDISEIDAAAQRAVALTGQLLAFTRRQSPGTTLAALHPVVEKTSKMLRRLLGASIELVLVGSASRGEIATEAGAIEQILMNLAVNARDAMPDGGALTIETQDVFIGEELGIEDGFPQPGPYVMLAVSDNGIGMDAATQAHIFEALYTTKPPGKGTGLGLYTVAGIVKKAGGFIRVRSAPGEGTRFRLYFPRA